MCPPSAGESEKTWDHIPGWGSLNTDVGRSQTSQEIEARRDCLSTVQAEHVERKRAQAGLADGSLVWLAPSNMPYESFSSPQTVRVKWTMAGGEWVSSCIRVPVVLGPEQADIGVQLVLRKANEKKKETFEGVRLVVRTRNLFRLWGDKKHDEPQFRHWACSVQLRVAGATVEVPDHRPLPWSAAFPREHLTEHELSPELPKEIPPEACEVWLQAGSFDALKPASDEGFQPPRGAAKKGENFEQFLNRLGA